MNTKELLDLKLASLTSKKELGRVSIAAQPYLCARFLNAEKGSKFVLVQDNKTADRFLRENLNYGIRSHHLRLPKSRYEFLTISTILSRLSIEPQNIIVSLETFFSNSIPDSFNQDLLKLKVSENIPIQKLSELLVDIGYEKEDNSYVPGTFSALGGFVSIFPLNLTNPIRLEFVGTKIESIYEFEDATGIKIKDHKNVEILPFIQNAQKSLFDLFEKLPGNPKLIWFNPELGTELLTEKELKQLSKITDTTVSVLKKVKNLDLSTPQKFEHQFENLTSFLELFISKGFKIYINTRFKDEVEPLLFEKNIKSTFIDSELNLDFGFIAESDRFVVLTDQEIFGKRESKESTRRRTRAIRDLIMGLKPSDLVVHIDHGLGRFTEIKKIDFEGIEREYLTIEYAGTDKLYVPVEVADRLTRYVKVTETAPPLARLGSTEWITTRTKVKESAEKLAHELLDIYAKRAVTEREPYLPDKDWQKILASTFQFKETPDQDLAIKTILQNMETLETPLDILLTADVGYGKTEVAIRVAAKAVVSGRQVAILAPTTILAEQHFVTLQRRLKGFPIKIGVLSRLVENQIQKENISKIATGEIDIVVGTHRLLSKDIKFRDLGLLIIDEEQRFGVEQKERLKALRTSVDVLAMTATPIPRSMYLSLSGIRDILTIKTPPENRKPIETFVEKSDEDLIKKALHLELKRKGQVYFLHNDVETIDLAALKLQKLVPKSTKISIAHGQLPPDQLVDRMRDFAQGLTDILVCSTIIENGLDLPNVNTLIVENSPNFGLSQLHQLRGRIGRGDKTAYAYFLFGSDVLKEDALKRLEILIETQKLGGGFDVAMRDLELRGAGNLLGREQHGSISAVGISLYARLLEEAVNKLKTGEKPSEFETQLDLPLPITIPADYITDAEERLKTYQMLGSSVSFEELNYEKSELERKFGKIPSNIENLFALLELKLNAQKAGITNISIKELRTPYGEQKLKLYLIFWKDIKPNQTSKLLEISNFWQITERQSKIDLQYLGKNWFLTLRDLIQSL